MTTFRVWVFGCSHLTRDIRNYGLQSLGRAIAHSESEDFGGWDIAIDLGDHCGGVDETPTRKDGDEVVRQFGALRHHARESIYSVQGNHDREGPGQPKGWWFRRFVDPLSENTIISGVDSASRPYAIDGTWERYKFQVGNIVFLMMSDVTRPETNMRGILGGDPGGVVSAETLEWWLDQVASYRNGSEIVITCHHYLPKNTTAGTGDYEGGTLSNGVYVRLYHGPGKEPKGSGRLHYIDEESDTTSFIDHLQAHQGDCAIWLGAHTHARPGTEINGRKLREELYGCHFVNCAALTKYHGAGKVQQYPRSRVFTFTDDSNEVVIRNWYHDTSYAPTVGYYGQPVNLTIGKTVQL